MDKQIHTPPHSQLFTLRLWPEEDGDGRSVWRGKIHCVTTNDTRYFRDWSAVVPLLLHMLREAEKVSFPPDAPTDHRDLP